MGIRLTIPHGIGAMLVAKPVGISVPMMGVLGRDTLGGKITASQASIRW